MNIKHLAKRLQIVDDVVFCIDGHTINVYESSSEDGYVMDIYKGHINMDDIASGDYEPIDGGLCTGNAEQAIEWSIEMVKGSGDVIVKLLKELQSLDVKIRTVTATLDDMLERKLGEGWGVVQQLDGICLIDINADNYCIQVDKLGELLKESRSVIISTLKANYSI